MQNAQGSGPGSPPSGMSGMAGEAVEGAKNHAGGLMGEAREKASHLVENAKAQALGAADQKKATAADTLGSVAGALRQAAQKLEEDQVAPLGTYATGAADQVDRVARYLRDRDLQSLTRDAETFARRHPEVFLGGAFVAGLLAARFLKSSGRRGDGGDTMAGAMDPGDSAGYTAAYGSGYAAPTYANTATPSAAAASGTSTVYSTGTPAEPFNPPHVDGTGGGQ